MALTTKPTRKTRTTETVATADDRSSGPVTAPRSAAPSQDDIARRAFELYCNRGSQHGHDLDDWLLAEHELLKA
jgi:hypothetical protein